MEWRTRTRESAMFLEKVTRSRPPLSESRTQVLHEIFERQADAHPTAAAVIFDGKETSYRGVERHANRIARRLRRSALARGSLVAVMLPRSPDAYASILGILKAGAAYVPIDTECPADRVAYLVDDCRASALVTHADLAARLPMLGVRMIRVDADGDDLLVESPERLPPEQTGVGRRDLCYVIYTSGTTGQPKGVMVEHRSACHLVETEREIYGVRADDRVFQGASLSFDLSVEEIWLAFRAGATLVPATNEMVRSGPDLSRFLRESGVTVLSSVPTLLAMLTDDVPALRLLITGGEACPERLVRHWARPGLRMLNTYGPTETTVIATVADMQPGRPVTIGRAIPGYRIHLLDDDLKPVAPGETGPICIGGGGVARGYLRRPELTREKFVPDPFAPVGEKDPRLYLSGDLGRLDGEGNIEFMGRADSQVKLRGFRIELAEIESVLMQADGVRAAACAVREDASGLQRLVAWVVPVNGKIEEARLRPYLREKLPAYMVPRLIEPVPELPLLPSGKLDRDALPTPRSSRFRSCRSCRAASSIATRFRPRAGWRRPGRTGRGGRGRRPSDGSPPFGKRSSSRNRSPSTTTSSSISAATRCSRHAWCRSCGGSRDSLTFPCSTSMRSRPSPRSPRRSTPRSAPRRRSRSRDPDRPDRPDPPDLLSRRLVASARGRPPAVTSSPGSSRRSASTSCSPSAASSG